MQRVTNCILHQNGEVLMLRKPRRGWWTAPGGKMEAEESIYESVIREYHEETGLLLIEPELKGVFTIIIEEQGNITEEWMMFTFFADQADGDVVEECVEGVLQWHPVDELIQLPTAEGDQLFLTPIARGSKLMTGKFKYTPNFELISWQLDDGAAKGKNI